MSPDEFWHVTDKGKSLRLLHLMDPAVAGEALFPLKWAGDGQVIDFRFADGKVWISEQQYFDGVANTAWNQYVGGYQPAQKWLKDRVGRELTYEDIKHYQRLIKVLVETARVSGEIEMEFSTAS